MTLDMIISFIMNNLIPVIIGLIILFLVVRRLIKTAKMHVAMKSFLKQASKLDKKKFNGVSLVDKIKKKRKRHTNSFAMLRRRAKMKVKQYLTHKIDELPVVVKYSQGKMFKRAKNKLYITIANSKKVIKKVPIKKGQKPLIECMDQYECVDEIITFLHFLPQAILHKEPYDTYVNETDVTISYYIK